MIVNTSCIAGVQYLPSVEYFAHWIHHGILIIEKHENYQKRTWRNKTAILGPQRAFPLTVPLRKGKNHQTPITNVEIAYDEKWPNAHLNSLRTAYGKTAFFEQFEDDIIAIYKTMPQYLWELNLNFIQYIITFFPGHWKIDHTLSYEPILPNSITDLRSGVPAGESSLMTQSFPVYEQIHRLKNSHLPNLSILDALCHLGPGTHQYLKRYAAELYSESWLR